MPADGDLGPPENALAEERARGAAARSATRSPL